MTEFEDVLLLEDGSFLFLETGGDIALEDSGIEVPVVVVSETPKKKSGGGYLFLNMPEKRKEKPKIYLGEIIRSLKNGQ